MSTSIYEHKTSFAGYTIVPWNDGPLLNTATTAYRLTTEFDSVETWPEKLARFAHRPNSDQVEALIVGASSEQFKQGSYLHSTAHCVEALIAQRHHLPNLRALFIPDVIRQESEISWIEQTNLGPLLAAFPHLTHLGIRGSLNLRLYPCQHAHLRSLTIESGGLPREALEDLLLADLPQLLDLELWTGDQWYGWDGTLNDLLPFVQGVVFPNLKRLGICDCEITDAVVNALVNGPLLARLEHLDLSRGTLGDEGAQRLVSHPAVRQLKTLDVRHHFCTLPLVAQLQALGMYGVNVLIDDAQPLQDEDDGPGGRYVAIGE